MTQSELLKQKPLFDQYNNRTTHRLSAFHFSYILGWSSFFEFDFKLIDDRLCIFASNSSGTFLYLPPLGGEFSINTIQTCFKHMGEISIKRHVARIENLEKVVSGTTFSLHERAGEYLYHKADLIGLEGQAYKSQRHDINHVVASCDVSFEEFKSEHIPACLELYRSWSRERALHHPDDPIYVSMLEDNAIVHECLMRYATELGLVGRVAIIENRVCAYSFGYSLNSDIFCISLEVTDLSKKGLAAYIFQKFCADPIWSTHQWVNTMDDFGLPNVAQTKKAYHPIELIPSHTLYLK